MRLKEKGFTLVELLVVIVILEIITGISIPLIRNIRDRNENRQYTAYMDSLKSSAKLYVDSYSEDLFGHEESSCAIVRYSQLEEKGLLKDIAVNDISCNSEDTLVRVVKVNNKYSYSPMISCGEKKNGTVSSDIKLPEGGIGGIDVCGIDIDTIMSFSASTSPNKSINFQKRNITLSINSPTGIFEDVKIYYGFLKESDKKADGEDPVTVLTNGWKELKFDIPGTNEQKRTIENGKIITITSDMVQTPDIITDDIYLVVRIDSLKNISGRNWTTDLNQSKYLYFGTFRVDNTKPVFDASSNVISSKDGYYDIQPKLNLKVTDEKYSKAEDMKMCIAYDVNTCSKKVKDIKNSNGYKKYNPNKILPKIQNNFDGSNHTVYVNIADAAGNLEIKNYTYKISVNRTLTYNSNGGSECDPAKKSVYYDTNAPAWGDLCKPTRTNYTFLGWNTKADGSGTTVTKDSTANNNVTVYAQWRKNKVYFQFKLQNGESLTSPTTDTNGASHTWNKDGNSIITRDGATYKYSINFDASTMNLPNYNYNKNLYITRNGYQGKSGEEWICDSGCKTANSKFTHNEKTTSASINASICDYSTKDCTVTLKVNWTITSYTIAFDYNGGSNSGNPTSYTIESNAITLKNPTREGYEFTGWTGSNGATASTNVTIPTGSYGNKNYKANWKRLIYTITYNGNGNTGGSTASNSCNYNENCNLTTNGFTKTDWNFDGWYSAASGGTKYGISTKLTENITVYAHWTRSWTFPYTGGVQTFTAPLNGTYKLEVWGAQGGEDGGNAGGKGGYSYGNYVLSKNAHLYVYVGGDGCYGRDERCAGWNGGGVPGNRDYSGGGGGATDMRTTNGAWNDTTSLNSRIIVAGGGGGGGWYGGTVGTSHDCGAGGGSGYISKDLTSAGMLAGNQSFPKPIGLENETGHPSDGYAKITIVSH